MSIFIFVTNILYCWKRRKDFSTAHFETPFICARRVTVFKKLKIFNRKTECVKDVTMHLSIFVCICNKTGCVSFLSPFCKRRHKLRCYGVVIIMSLCVPCSAPRRFVNGKQNNREKRGTVRNSKVLRKCGTHFHRLYIRV